MEDIKLELKETEKRDSRFTLISIKSFCSLKKNLSILLRLFSSIFIKGDSWCLPSFAAK